MSPPKRARRRALTLGLVTAVCVPVLTACGSSSSSTTSTSASSTVPAGASTAALITTAWPADVTSLDPANLSTDEDHSLHATSTRPCCCRI